MFRRLTTTLVVWLIGISACQAVTVVYVDADAPGPVRNGLSWATAFATIGQAISASPLGAEIWVADGIYRESVVISSFRKLYGGFTGCETSISKRLIGAFPTVIDAGGTGRCVDILRDVRPTLDGFTLRNGRADIGAGIRCATDTTSVIANCRIEQCRATQWGGGMYMAPYSYGDITNCVFIRNRAPEGGGAYIEYHSYPVLRNCLFARNHATVSGGGVYGPYHAGPLFEYCTIAYNSAELNGGGAYDQRGSPMTFNYCIIAFNTAPVGAGLFGDGPSSALEYNYSNLYGNVEGNVGGAVAPISPVYGNFSADPLFVMPDCNEFRLSPGTPCPMTGAYPLDAPRSFDRLGIARLLPDGTQVRIDRVIVSAVDGTTVYLQSPDRSTAIACHGLSGLQAGDVLASVTGTLTSDAGVKTLSSATSVSHTASCFALKPLGTTLPAVTSTAGAYITVWGRAVSVTDGGFTLTDGVTSIPVRWGGTVTDGDLVSVTGVYTLDSDLLALQVSTQ